MNETVQLLQDVVRNARTGLDAVEQLMQRTEGGGMRDELARERDAYIESARDGEQALADAGGKPEPSGLLSRAGMWLGLAADTLADRSDAHIAEIVIQGATMGVIEMTKARGEYAEANLQAQGVASDLLARQQDGIERMKAFL